MYVPSLVGNLCVICCYWLQIDVSYQSIPYIQHCAFFYSATSDADRRLSVVTCMICNAAQLYKQYSCKLAEFKKRELLKYASPKISQETTKPSTSGQFVLVSPCFFITFSIFHSSAKNGNAALILPRYYFLYSKSRKKVKLTVDCRTLN